MVVGEREDFAVRWDDPADAELTWLYDPMHFPKPVLPLAGEFLDRMYQEFMSSRTILVNNYAFSTIPTPRPPSPAILERGALDVWMNDNMPRVRAFCERIRSVDYDSLSLPKLGEAVSEIVAEAVQVFGLTMEVISGFMGPTFGFVQFLQQELGPDAPRVAATLLQGYENGTAAAGAGLGELAMEASRYPAVADAIRRGQYESLESLEGGREFMVSFQEYLDEFGWRLETWGEVDRPTWTENPRTPLMLIGRYLADPDRSPAASIRRAVQQREEAVREVEAQLPAEKVGQFRSMLTVAQAHVPMSEGRALWQLIIIGSLRMPLLALGRKLVEAGALNSPEGVFYLRTEELREAAAIPSQSTRETIAERRQGMERAAGMTPPPFLGAPPDPTKAPPEMQALASLFFGAAPPEVEGRQLKGQAASKGVAHGTARVIHSLADAERLQAGEILVCTTTAPPWTPLFAIAGGVVTDSGGVLSHSAICAREYAIPCVVATQIATRIIPDGATITVDGSKGVVTIEG